MPGGSRLALFWIRAIGLFCLYTVHGDVQRTLQRLNLTVCQINSTYHSQICILTWSHHIQISDKLFFITNYYTYTFTCCKICYVQIKLMQINNRGIKCCLLSKQMWWFIVCLVVGKDRLLVNNVLLIIANHQPSLTCNRWFNIYIIFFW